jgi:hypothetical protein
MTCQQLHPHQNMKQAPSLSYPVIVAIPTLISPRTWTHSIHTALRPNVTFYVVPASSKRCGRTSTREPGIYRGTKDLRTSGRTTIAHALTSGMRCSRCGVESVNSRVCRMTPLVFRVTAKEHPFSQFLQTGMYFPQLLSYAASEARKLKCWGCVKCANSFGCAL